MPLQLQDEEILAIRQIQVELNQKFSMRPRTEATINAIESEAIEKIAALGWIASVDAFPILQGEELSITLIQRIDPNYTFDHEKKAYDVKQARTKGETIHGESRGTS
jgi:hypothetical protein